MTEVLEKLTSVTAPVGDEATRFYRDVMRNLTRHRVPFLIGGAFALHHFTGIERDTKDLDLFISWADFSRAERVLQDAGFHTELTYPHWLAKVRLKLGEGEPFIDLIFNSGNGMTPVDDTWFEHAEDAMVLGERVKVHPAEEMLWSKSFIMERERYDGADVAHLLKACARKLDWQRLMRRFEPHWRILLSHLVLFGFIYPDHRDDVPGWVMARLLDKAAQDLLDTPHPRAARYVCGGTVISRQQYLDDVAQGYLDGRLQAPGCMTEDDIAHWTRSINTGP